MKKLLLSLAVIVGVCSAASATTWRINSNPKAKAHFLTLKDAMSSLDVKSGDVLMLDPGAHAGATINKQVTIVGTGYLLADNKDWKETASASITSNLSLSSDGGRVIGVSVSHISVEADNCEIDRCYGAVRLETVANASITNCYLTYVGVSTSAPTNYVVSNCIIAGAIDIKYYTSSPSGTVKNCVIYGNCKSGYLVNVQNAEFYNNIVINTNTEYKVENEESVLYRNICTINFNESRGNTFTNNVINIDPEYASPVYTDNKCVGNVALTDVFAWGEGLERRFMLSADSPAKGYATDGSDCGAFGGSTPYVLSGIPQFYPHITEVSIPTKTSDNKLKVTLKIVNQNE